MYLEPSQVHNLFETLRACAGSADLLLAFSGLEPAELTTSGSPLSRLDAALRRRGRGEKLRWLKQRAKLRTWLAEMGWSHRQSQDVPLATELPPPANHRSYGEWVALAGVKPSSLGVVSPAQTSKCARGPIRETPDLG